MPLSSFIITALSVRARLLLPHCPVSKLSAGSSYTTKKQQIKATAQARVRHHGNLMY